MNVLVTDGENRSALVVTRSLGKKGHNVIVTGRKLECIAMCSKYCLKSYKTPDPLNAASDYYQAIEGIVNRDHIDVIFPITEQSVYVLNNARELLSNRVILACAPTKMMEAVSNKYNLFQLAEKLHVPIPSTVYIGDMKDFLEKRTLISDFPVVIKPAYSKIVVGDKIISTGVMYASNLNELNKLYDTRPELSFPSMIQEMIVGSGTGLFTLFDENRHIALFSHRRLLEKPPSGGVSVLSESVPLDSEMVEQSRQLLSSVGWQGIAMVEFKRDIRDGRAKLIEINGRFWGSLQLAVSSGVDFPDLCMDYYLGRKPADVFTDYVEGHQLKWFLGILDHLIIRLKNNNKYKDHIEIPAIWRVIFELVKSAGVNTSSDVYDANDPRPFYSELKEYIRNLLRLKI